MSNKELKTQDEIFIDLDKMVRNSSFKKMRYVPQFFVDYLKRIVHQEEINKFLSENVDTPKEEFLDKSLDFLEVTQVFKGIENLPSDNKKYIFFANHPLGGIDGLMLINYISKKISPAKAIINDLLLNIKPLQAFFVGVNLYGEKSKDSVLKVEQLFSSDNQVIIFPAGLVSRKIKGKIQDLKWKTTFVKKAIKHNRDIVPVYVDGQLSKFFYRLSNLRKFFGIKFNFELIYLSDEMFKQRGQTIKIVFGKPIPVSSLDRSLSYDALAEKMRQKVYELA